MSKANAKFPPAATSAGLRRGGCSLLPPAASLACGRSRIEPSSPIRRPVPRGPEAPARQRAAPSGAKAVCWNRLFAGTDLRSAMFDSLSERLGGILDRLTRRGALSEADVDAALREVRRALLEADVALA